MAADDAHHQPRAGASIAEIEFSTRFEQRADADAIDCPSAGAAPLDPRPERAAGFAGMEHVFAFEQPLDLGAPDGQKPENEGTMRDRFIARRPQAALERPARRRTDGRGRRRNAHGNSQNPSNPGKFAMSAP